MTPLEIISLVCNMWYFTLLLFVVSAYYGQAYKAAVVHYYPAVGTTAEETILKNMNEYRKYANKAKSKGVDIIVFPEYGLVTTSALANPGEYSLEIQSPIIAQIGTIARDNGVYLVVNLFERIDDKYYNTNLVFDRNGTLILKYHKSHLYNEFGLTPGTPNQTITFSTDFGVTFGIFTCFDMLFANPSLRVLEGGNVTDVIFVLGWLPSYISLSIQHGYCVANGVNLLAANYGRHIDGRSGTGIYLSDGKVAKVVNDSVKSQLVVREVPPKSLETEKTCPRSVKEKTHTVVTTSKYYFHDVDLTKKFTSTQLCNGNFCCTFQVTLDMRQKNPTDIYKLMIFDDSVSYDKLEANFRICTLLACRNEFVDSCGAMANVTSTFKRISVQGNFTKDNSTFYRPITLHTSLSPLTPTAYCQANSSVHLGTKNQKGVIIFGIFERKDTVSERRDDIDGARNSKIFLVLTWGRPYYFAFFKSSVFD